MTHADTVELTVRTAGAVRRAPRVLRAWMTDTETCVRDDAGVLLWLATDAQTAWVHDAHLVAAPTRDDDDEEGLLREPAPEVAALRSLRSATSWLGADPEPISSAAGARLFGRDIDWFDLSHPTVRNLRVARDTQTGIILHISGTNPVYGDLLIEVTSIAVLPPDGASFQARLQL
jgi:hypothetical protein